MSILGATLLVLPLAYVSHMKPAVGKGLPSILAFGMPRCFPRVRVTQKEVRDTVPKHVLLSIDGGR